MTRTARKPISPVGLAKRLAAEIGGYILLIVGVAALFLPGPGLLLIAAGLALLSTQYQWADKLLHPLKARAYHLAAESVQTWPRIAMSTLGALVIVTVGILWGMDFPEPRWWPIHPKWWLFGGWTAGITMMASGVFALGLIVYSFIRFRRPRDVPAPRRP